MRRLLLLSFDYFRAEEPQASYALACLSSAVLADDDLWREWAVDVVSVDLSREVPWSPRGLKNVVVPKARFERYDVVALGDYCWSSRYVADMLALLREWQPGARVLLGGYQVTSTPEERLQEYYPALPQQPVTFLKGFAETSLCSALRCVSEGRDLPRIMKHPVACRALPSPWLTGEVALDAWHEKVRWETKRGCLYRCDYCEFKAATNSPRTPKEMVLAMDRLAEELELFRRHGVKKVNVLDPLFNIPGTYEKLLGPMLASGLTFTLQTRIELLDQQEPLIDAARKSKQLRLEIGVQTLDERLNGLLCRKNQKDRILSTLSRLKKEGVSFETNLIFGIPGQTVSAHVEDIETLMRAGCEKKDILCFPLRIPRGSDLDARRAELHVEEAPYAAGGEVVVKANHFDQADWLRMLLASEADESYLDRLREMGSASFEGRDGRLARRSWILDGAVWSAALAKRGYKFRVMVVDPDAVLRQDGEYDVLEFVLGDGPFGRIRLVPGFFYALSWMERVSGNDRPQRKRDRYVLLERSVFGLRYSRPARIVCEVLDVSNQVLVLWVTWRVERREALRLIRHQIRQRWRRAGAQASGP